MKRIIAAIITGGLFVGLIAALKIYDVAAIGPDDTSIGFSHLNRAVHEATGVNMEWYEITEYFGYAAIAVCALFALAGLVQLVRRRSLLKVDREILSLGVLFATVMIFYVFFEKIIINYRPIIMPGASKPEASFPSSHTMLVVTVMIATSLIIGRYIKSSALANIIKTLCCFAAMVTVAGRLYSGVHWLTDIIGGVLLSDTLLLLFAAATEVDKEERLPLWSE